MRREEEIQHRLEEAELQLEGVKDWANSAHERYREDKRVWGEADPGEVDAAHAELGKLEREVSTLKWVLEQTNKKEHEQT